MLFFLCKNFFAHKPSTQSSLVQSFWQLLNSPDHNGPEIIVFLSANDPRPLTEDEFNLGQIFAESAGVKEEYPIGVHTNMVFKVLAQQYDTYMRFHQIEIDPSIRLLPILKLAVALHDTGKPFALLMCHQSLIF